MSRGEQPYNAKVRGGPYVTFSAPCPAPRRGPGAGKAGGTIKTAAASTGHGPSKGPRPKGQGGATGTTWVGGSPGSGRGPRTEADGGSPGKKVPPPTSSKSTKRQREEPNRPRRASLEDQRPETSTKQRTNAKRRNESHKRLQPWQRSLNLRDRSPRLSHNHCRKGLCRG